MFPWARVNRMKDQLTNHMSTTNTQNKGQCDKGVHFDKYPNKEQYLVTISCIVWVLTNVMQGLFKNNLSRKTIEQFSHGKLSQCKYLNWFMLKQINFGSGLECSPRVQSGQTKFSNSTRVPHAYGLLRELLRPNRTISANY